MLSDAIRTNGNMRPGRGRKGRGQRRAKIGERRKASGMALKYRPEAEWDRAQGHSVLWTDTAGKRGRRAMLCRVRLCFVKRMDAKVMYGVGME